MKIRNSKEIKVEKHHLLETSRYLRDFLKMSTINQYDGFDVTLSVDGIRTIKLNRPKKKNALTIDMFSTLSNALEDANVDTSTKFVVLTGTGDNFIRLGRIHSNLV